MGDDEGNLDRPRVLAVTVNPSLDTTAQIGRVEVNAKLRSEASEHQSGGGGIDVSRAMKVLGADSYALWTRGGPFGTYVNDLLEVVRPEGTAMVEVNLGERSLSQ